MAGPDRSSDLEARVAALEKQVEGLAAGLATTKALVDALATSPAAGWRLAFAHRNSGLPKVHLSAPWLAVLLCPSALDNRPMRFDEWEGVIPRALYVSATPAIYELQKSRGCVAEQVIRPTGLVDPQITVKPAQGQVPDLVEEIKLRVARNERVLVTTLTKKLAEDLANYLTELNIKGRYLHSEVKTVERVQILRDLREGKFDCLVGVNLLREGLDLPEVTLVAILDADKEGFLRSETSIIQTVGRTARNVSGSVILYADTMTTSMKKAISETERRRAIQLKYNADHGITPKTIEKAIRHGIEEIIRSQHEASRMVNLDDSEYELSEVLKEIEREMFEAAEKLDFERAAELRDQIRQLTEGGGGGAAGAAAGATTVMPGGRGGKGKGKRWRAPAPPRVRGSEARLMNIKIEGGLRR